MTEFRREKTASTSIDPVSSVKGPILDFTFFFDVTYSYMKNFKVLVLISSLLFFP